MSLKELLELAHLEALGLLDEEEQQSYDRAFEAAPPAIRDHVRAEQARWSSMEPLLPHASPPPDLRDRVLAAVEQAMIRDEALGEPGSVDILPGRRVTSRWRTASIALVMAVVALSAAFIHVYTINADMRGTIESNSEESRRLTTWGSSTPLRDSLFDARVVHAFFRPVDENSRARAAIFIHPDWTSSKLFCEGLTVAEGRNVRLCLVDEKNNVLKELAIFAPDGSLTRVDAASPSPLNGARLALVSAPRGGRAEEGEVLMTATIA